MVALVRTGFIVIMIVLAILVFVVLRRRRANDAEALKFLADSKEADLVEEERQAATSPGIPITKAEQPLGAQSLAHTEIELVLDDDSSMMMSTARKARAPVA